MTPKLSQYVVCHLPCRLLPLFFRHRVNLEEIRVLLVDPERIEVDELVLRQQSSDQAAVTTEETAVDQNDRPGTAYPLCDSRVWHGDQLAMAGSREHVCRPNSRPDAISIAMKPGRWPVTARMKNRRSWNSTRRRLESDVRDSASETPGGGEPNPSQRDQPFGSGDRFCCTAFLILSLRD